jgi:hypothetical protein
MDEEEANDERLKPDQPPKDNKGLINSTSGDWIAEELKEEEDDFPVMPPPNHNVTYGLYSLCKNDGGRRINLVVRSSYHAYEVI